MRCHWRRWGGGGGGGGSVLRMHCWQSIVPCLFTRQVSHHMTQVFVVSWCSGLVVSDSDNSLFQTVTIPSNTQFCA